MSRTVAVTRQRLSAAGEHGCDVPAGDRANVQEFPSIEQMYQALLDQKVRMNN
jgi:hypothetical protein